MLDPNPETRINADQSLNHAWIESNSLEFRPTEESCDSDDMINSELDCISELSFDGQLSIPINSDKSDPHPVESLSLNLIYLREFNQMVRRSHSALVSCGVIQFENSGRFENERKIAKISSPSESRRNSEVTNTLQEDDIESIAF